MKEKINHLLEEVKQFNAESADHLEQIRIRFLGRKGLLQDLFDAFKDLPGDQKRDVGQLLNVLKNAAQDKLTLLKESFESNAPVSALEDDLTKPAGFREPGTRHPLSIVRNQMISIFARLGFTVSEGPEIEDDWHNFSALNFPPEHPARDMQDTFFIEKDPDIALRTHTSSVQIRMMENTKPPIRAIFPGRVFRNEAISARAHC